MARMIFLKINLNLLVQISHLWDKIQTPYPAHKILHDLCSSQPRTYLLTFVHLDSFPGTFLSIHSLLTLSILQNATYMSATPGHLPWRPKLSQSLPLGFHSPGASLYHCACHTIFSLPAY